MASLKDREQKRGSAVAGIIAYSNDTVSNKQKDQEKVKKVRQQSYYITEDHIKALEMKLYKEKIGGNMKCDKSYIVRQMFDKFLEIELEELKKN